MPRPRWHLAQALIAAESVGAVEVALERSVAYAKERFTFGRAIGSYQAVKHELVEILRRLENARSLMFYAGWAWQDRPDELAAGQRGVPARRRAAPSTTPRARRSPSTAASGPPGSTTRRSTTAARSSRGGCWAARPAPPPGWRTSCSPPRRAESRSTRCSLAGLRLDARPLALPAP